MPEIFRGVRAQKKRPNIKLEREKISGGDLPTGIPEAVSQDGKRILPAVFVPSPPAAGGGRQSTGQAPAPAVPQAPPAPISREPLPPRPTLASQAAGPIPPAGAARPSRLSIPATLVRLVRKGMKVGELRGNLNERRTRELEEEKKAHAKLLAIQDRIYDLQDLLRQMESMDENAEVLQ